MTSIVASLLLAALIGGCKKDEYVEIVGVCPVVESTNPANAATNVPMNQIVTATFNEEMNPVTITQSSFTLTGGLKSGVPVPGIVSYDNTHATLSFAPTANLSPNTTYTGTVKSTIKDLKGNALQTNYVWTFSTGAILSPTVITTDPVNAETGVFINKVVSATFSIPMDPATITAAAFTLKQGNLSIAGVISYSGVTASLTPGSNLAPNTVYTATIATVAKNLAGTTLESNYVWSFTTGSTLGPAVISTDPTNNAIGVLLGKTVTATFSMAMDPLTITDLTFTVKQGLTTVAGTVSYTGATASFIPTALLTPNTSYVCTITTGAKNVAGISLTSNYVWTFTTGSFVPPTVISTDPANTATGVILSKKVTATFSVPMDPLTLTGTTFTIKQGTTPVAGTVSFIGSVATFAPTTDLLPGTIYTATVTTGAKNVAGIPLASDYVWTFTTLTSTSAPVVILTDPADKALNVDLLKNVTATFSMPINPLTMIAANFTIYHGTTPIGGVISYNGSTATFDPLSTLLPNTEYTCTITTGVQSIAGTPMAVNYVWTFATLPLVAPVVITTNPIDNALDVDLLKQVTATFSMPMNPATINASNFTVYHGTTPIAGTISYNGSTATFAPVSTLLSNTVYTCTINTGVQNATGIPMVNNYVWSFTTLSVSAPMIISTDPLDNATDVDLSKTIAATFNTPMNPSTINASTFTIYHGTTLIGGTISFSGSTATFVPASSLLANTLYTCTITTGALTIAGVPMLTDYVWSFTTASGIIPPVVIDLGTAAIFGAFGGNAGVTNQGINTVVHGAISSTAASTLITGFHDGMTGDVYTETPLNVGLVTNGIFTAPPFPGTATSFAIATQGLLDANIAYNSISPASMPGGIDPGAGELGGLTLAPGIYKSASGTFKISNGPLTLDAQGDPNATWVFQTAAGLTVGIAGPTGARSIVLINGALPKNVFWYVGTAATINGAGGGIMVGTIIAYSGVTFSTAGNAVQTVLNGRALSLVASVTMVNTTVNVPSN